MCIIVPEDGIEPSSRVYESLVLPLNYTGAISIYYIILLFTKSLVGYKNFFLKARSHDGKSRILGFDKSKSGLAAKSCFTSRGGVTVTRKAQSWADITAMRC